MPIALAVSSIRQGRRHVEVSFVATITDNYTGGGDTIDFTVATDPKFLGYEVPGVAPEELSYAGGLGGRWATPIIGATNKTSKLKVWDTKDNELAAGAYPATTKADVTRILAKFPKLN